MHPHAHPLHSQLDAAIAMLADCIALCPPDNWDTPIAKYPFWQVAYHTLCYADIYVLTDNMWRPHAVFHPRGRAELDDEYPSRRFTQPELIDYAAFCRAQALAALAAETPDSLLAPSGFPRHPFSRTELHIYNARHIQHHTGQLSASLRRANVDTRWIKAGA